MMSERFIPSLMGVIGVAVIFLGSLPARGQPIDAHLSALPLSSATRIEMAQRQSGPVARIRPDHLDVRQGEKALFENVSIYDPDGHLKRVEWSGPGDQKGKGDTFEVRTDQLSPGTYKVTLSITDNHGQSSSISANLVVAPRPPEMRVHPLVPGVERQPGRLQETKLTVEIAPTYVRIEQGGRVMYRSRVTTGADCRLVSQEWTGPGNQRGRGDTFEVRTDDLSPGRHDVSLRVADSCRRSASGTATLEVVSESDYTVAISAQPESVKKGEAVGFTASITPRVPGAEFMFDFGDSASSGWISQPRVTHEYSSSGTYYASVSVKAQDRIIAGSAKVAVEVTAPAPMRVRLTSDKDRAEPRERVAFQVITEPRYRDIEYLFSFGDGGASDWTGTPTAEHAYSKEGVYKVFVAVRVKGEQRGESPPITIAVKEARRKPVAKIAPEQLKVTQGERARYQSLSTPKEGIRERWKGPGNQTASGSAFEMSTDHLAPGRHDVLLEVTDESGQHDSARAVLEVLARTEYRVDLRAYPAATEAGKGVRFDAVLAPVVQGAEFRFTFGDGTVTQWARDPVVHHTYASPGILQAEVAARIGDRIIGSARTEVRVEAPHKAIRIVLHADRNRVGPGGKVHFRVSTEPSVQKADYFYNFGDSLSSGWMGQPDIDHSYQQEGTYRAVVTVRLADSRLIASEAVSITVAGVPGGLPQPVVKITPEHLSVAQGERAVFESQSTPRWSIQESWRGPAGQAGKGRRFELVTDRLSPGPYDIVLSVTDSSGVTQEASAVLEIVPLLREVVCEVLPNPVKLSKTATFSARAEPRIDGIEYRFLFGDNAVTEWSPLPRAGHVYAAAGRYEASVSARFGGQVIAQSKPVTVTVMDGGGPPGPWVAGGVALLLGVGYYLLRRFWPRIAVRPNVDGGIQRIEADATKLIGSEIRLRPVVDSGKQEIEVGGSLIEEERRLHE